MNEVKLFDTKKIRSHFDEKEEVWFFSLVDIVEALTDSTNPTDYLKKIRKRDAELAAYIGTNCPYVEMETTTGKNLTNLTKKSHSLRNGFVLKRKILENFFIF